MSSHHIGSNAQAGPSSPISDEEDGGFGLGDLMTVSHIVTSGRATLTSQEPESPTPIPFSFATYEPPEGFSLDLPDERKHVITRLVGSHPLWGHYLCVLASDCTSSAHSVQVEHLDNPFALPVEESADLQGQKRSGARRRSWIAELGIGRLGCWVGVGDGLS